MVDHRVNPHFIYERLNHVKINTVMEKCNLQSWMMTTMRSPRFCYHWNAREPMNRQCEHIRVTRVAYTMLGRGSPIYELRWFAVSRHMSSLLRLARISVFYKSTDQRLGLEQPSPQNQHTPFRVLWCILRINIHCGTRAIKRLHCTVISNGC